jgi:hypothetical protein
MALFPGNQQTSLLASNTGETIVTKVEELKQLKEMLDQNLINQDEYDKLRSEILNAMSPPPQMPPMGSIGRPFSIPAEPLGETTILRNPTTGATVTLKKWPTFWLTLFFGCFYLAYREVWLHAAIALALAVVTSGLSWLIYPFFAYRLIVDSYQRKGWVVVSPPPPCEHKLRTPSTKWNNARRSTSNASVVRDIHGSKLRE